MISAIESQPAGASVDLVKQVEDRGHAVVKVFLLVPDDHAERDSPAGASRKELHPRTGRHRRHGRMVDPERLPDDPRSRCRADGAVRADGGRH